MSWLYCVSKLFFCILNTLWSLSGLLMCSDDTVIACNVVGKIVLCSRSFYIMALISSKLTITLIAGCLLTWSVLWLVCCCKQLGSAK